MDADLGFGDAPDGDGSAAKSGKLAVIRQQNATEKV